MYERMVEQTNWYFSWKEYTVLVIPSDFKSDKNRKMMFFGDRPIYLYF